MPTPGAHAQATPEFCLVPGLIGSKPVSGGKPGRVVVRINVCRVRVDGCGM